MKKFIELLKRPDLTRAQLFGVYTVLFAVTVILTFLPSLLTNTSLLWKTDGLLQHYENLVFLKHRIEQLWTEGSFPFWSWSIGLGSDSVASMVSMGYPCFDIFSYIVILFPEKYISAAYTVEVFLQLYTAGIGFLYFGKITNMSSKFTLWGALGYAFSSWALSTATFHSFFLTPMVWFVFIMAGVEKILRKQSPLVFILSVTMSVITTIYFSYMIAVMVFLYVVVFFVMKEQKTGRNLIRFWGRFILYAGIAACLSALIFIPGVYSLMYAVKDGAASSSLFHTFSSYVNYLSFLLGGQCVFEHFSTICVVPLFLLALPGIFHRIRLRKATPAMIVFVLCLFFLLFPIFNSVMNGFGYPSGRWCFIATFFYVWSSIQCMSETDFNIQKYKKSIAIMLAVFGCVLIVAGRIVLNINNEITTITGVINLGFSFAFYHLLSKPKRKSYVYLITFAIVCHTITTGCVQFFPGISSRLDRYMKYGEIYDKLSCSTQRAGTEIQDSSFYRIDQVDYISDIKNSDKKYTNTSYRPAHTPPNETLVFNTRSIYTYLSSTSGKLFDFYRNVGNSASCYRRTSTYGNDNRTRLDFLMGVKYFLGNNPKNNPPTGANEYASYGFSAKQKSTLGVEILQNKYCMGLGCTFDSYITESEWMQLDYPDREQALMECVVISDDMKTTLRHADAKRISSGAKQASVSITKGIDLFASEETAQGISSGKGGKFKVTLGGGDNFTIRLNGDYKDHELYFVARGLKRDPESTSEMKYSASSGKSLLDRMRARLTTGKNYDDAGSFIMDASMGTIKKRALNTVGTVQFFSEVEDYMINLGRYRENEKDIHVSFDTIGDYYFDSIEVLAVPLATYEDRVADCMNHSFHVTHFADDRVEGTVKTEADSSMLYASIPYNDGWQAYVDGQKVDTTRIDTAFTGIPVTGSGEHTVELRYRPVGFEIGIGALIVGVIGCILVCLLHRRRKKM